MHPRKVDPDAIQVFQEELAAPIMEAVKVRGNHGVKRKREDKMMAWGPIWDRMYELEEAGHSNVFELLNKIVRLMGGDATKTLRGIRYDYQRQQRQKRRAVITSCRTPYKSLSSQNSSPVSGGACSLHMHLLQGRR